MPLLAADADCQALFASSSEAEGSLAWFRILAETTLRHGETAILAVLSDQGGPRAALPLVRQQDGVVQSLTSLYSCLFHPPLGSPTDAYSLGKRLRQLIGRSLRLDCLDPEDPAIKSLIMGLRDGGMLVETFQHFGNWFETVSDFTTYWARRGTRLRETVRRKYRKLEKTDGVSFDCLRTPDEIAAGTSIYLDIYAKSWKVPESDAGFMPAMLAAMANEGDIRLGIIRLDGQPVAVQVWLVRQGRATIFKLAHLDGHAAHSPGTLLTWWLLSQIVDQERITEIDLGHGDDPYKQDWLSERRERIGIIACNPRRPLGLIDAARLIFAGRIKRWVQQVGAKQP